MAAVLSGLAGIPPFEFSTTDISGLANKWKSWKSSFEMVASGVTDNKQDRAVLLHMGGHQLQKLFQTLPDTGEDNDYDKCAQALDKYFEVKKIFLKKDRISYLRHRKGERRSII